MTEIEMVNNVKNGSLESFDLLMQNYQEQVYKVALSFTKNQDSAMDVTQNVFLKAYQNIAGFRGDSLFKTWLTRIAYNESQNWQKKNKHVFSDEDPDKTAAFDGIEEEYLANENRTTLLRSLYTLNTKYRLAVVLRYFENYSIREIADTLSCSEGVVKNMLFRSLQKLKLSLKDKDFGEQNVSR